MSDDAKVLPAGAVIGPYTIVRALGAGAFGAVYEARKAPLNKRIALKLLHADKAQNSAACARFVQEAQAAASLKHPHIVDVDDVGVIEGLPYLAMEFLEGEPLSSLLQRAGALRPDVAIDLLLPVFSAAAAVHACGIVHRDLKPDNLFLWKPVAGQTHPKLLDFGIAKVREGDGAALTKTGAIMGTPLYMSPEQWGGSKHASPQSDQWALGVILYQCLAGRVPFEADELPALMMAIAVHPAPPLRTWVPTLPEALESAVMRAIEKDPGQRHASVREFGKALLPFASAATRARWTEEFTGVAAPPDAVVEPGPAHAVAIGMMPTLGAPAMAASGGAFPNTLNASVRLLDPQPSSARRSRWALAAVGVLGACAVVVGSVAVRALSSSNEPAAPPAVMRSATTPAPAPPPAPNAPPAPTVAPAVPSAPIVAPVPSAPVPAAVPTAPPPTVSAPAAAPAPPEAPSSSPPPRRRRHHRRGTNGLLI
ncbi:MAG: serine/threonine-protein kinase [Polyangiales bacterium]